MEFVYEYGLFLLKAITIIAAIGVVIAIVASASMGQESNDDGAIEVVKINDRFDDMHKTIKRAIYDDGVVKKEEKTAEKEKKKQKKAAKKAGLAPDKEPQRYGSWLWISGQPIGSHSSKSHSLDHLCGQGGGQWRLYDGLCGQ